MTRCRILLHGLKPCDIIGSTKDDDSSPNSREAHSSNKSTPKNNNDYLNIDIKPLSTPTSSRSSTSSTTDHESSPIRVTIRETARGRHRICVSQTLLRAHTADV